MGLVLRIGKGIASGISEGRVENMKETVKKLSFKEKQKTDNEHMACVLGKVSKNTLGGPFKGIWERFRDSFRP